MRHSFRRIALATATAAATFGAPLPAMAQNLFAPVATVNDRVVTGYEVQQRARLLEMLNAPGDATEQLIEERLKLDAMAINGLSLTDAGIEAGIEEFAARANMTGEQFLRAIQAGGVEPESFKDFVIAGLGWRELIRARFLPRVQITDADVDKALNAISTGSGVRVLLSELIMAAPPPQAAAVRARAAELSQIETVEAFSAAARRYSAVPSRGRGGRLEWMPLTNLPPQLRPLLLALAPGQVTDPLPLEGAIALFQLRAIEETDYVAPEYSAIEYAAYYIEGGRSEAALKRAAQVKADVDTCDDLYGIAKGQPETVLDHGVKKPEELPQDIALELAKLDKGEVSTALTRADGQTLVFLMLCRRTPTVVEDASPEQIKVQIQNQRLERYARGYLEQLKADARIVRK
mgnify:CR=1 FL=1